MTSAYRSIRGLFSTQLADDEFRLKAGHEIARALFEGDTDRPLILACEAARASRQPLALETAQALRSLLEEATRWEH